MSANPIEIRRFELDVRLVDGIERCYEYNNDRDRVSASLTNVSLGKRQAWDEPESAAAVGDLLDRIAPSPQMSEYELIERSRAALHIEDADIQSLDVDIEFSDGSKVEAERVKSLRDSWHRHATLCGLP